MDSLGLYAKLCRIKFLENKGYLVDLTHFNFLILTKFDRKLGNNLEQVVKKSSQIEEELSPIELKRMLSEVVGLDVLDSNSSQVVDQAENIQITFAYILKCLSL